MNKGSVLLAVRHHGRHGSAAGLLVPSPLITRGLAGFIMGGVVAVGVLVALMRVSDSAWTQMGKRRLFDDEEEGPTDG